MATVSTLSNLDDLPVLVAFPTNPISPGQIPIGKDIDSMYFYGFDILANGIQFENLPPYSYFDNGAGGSTFDTSTVGKKGKKMIWTGPLSLTPCVRRVGGFVTFAWDVDVAVVGAKGRIDVTVAIEDQLVSITSPAGSDLDGTVRNQWVAVNLGTRSPISVDPKLPVKVELQFEVTTAAAGLVQPRFYFPAHPGGNFSAMRL